MMIDANYHDLAAAQVRLVRRYSGGASAILEEIYPLGAQAVCRAALVVVIYKGMIDMTGGIPEQFDYRHLITDFPEIEPYLERAISCLRRDWNYRRPQPFRTSF